MSERLPTEELNERFEFLTGRFLDGLLAEQEDLELSRLLVKYPGLASRFVVQVRIEHAIIGLSHQERLEEQAFAEAVQRSVDLMDNEVESERFAGEVVTLLRARTSVRVRRSMRQRRGAAPMQPALIAAIAAVFMLALLIALSGRGPSPINTTPENFRISGVDLRPSKVVEPDETPVAPKTRIVEAPGTPAVRESVATQTEEPVKNAIVEAPATPEVPVVQAPANTVKTPVPAAYAKSSVALASISKINGAKVLKQNSGAAESAARIEEVFFEADRVRVVASDASPGELPAGPLGAELVLKDGSRLWLQIGAALTLHSEKEASRPILESGELIARIKPQSAQSMLVIRTKQGVEAAVLGTVFRLSADSSSKRVNLKVEEGRVQFSSNGEKRIVTADEACSAEEGKAPLIPWQYRAHPASLAGTLIDKETGKPLAGAAVSVISVAERGTPVSKWSAKTDENGKFSINAIPEGPAYIFARTQEGGSAGLTGRGSVMRTKFVSGDKLTANLTLDKASLAAVRITEGGKPAADCEVRLITPSGDGQALDVKVSSTVKLVAGDYRVAAFEGAGRYTPVVEKKGFIARTRGANTYELRPDRVVNIALDVQFAPSAVLKGKVLNALTGAALADEPGTDLSDARNPRTTISLLTPAGQLQSVLAEADGSFAFDTNLDSGTYDLKVERFGFAPYVKRLTLTAGQKLDLNVPLDPQKLAKAR